jgi:glycogenin glucosyltransferase
MKQANGRPRFAFVTLFTLNDSYLPAVLLLAYGLRRQKTGADIICLVTPEITPTARKALAVLYDRVLPVEPIIVPHKLAGARPYLPLVFTKLHALRLGADGDLGLPYDKICLLDADLLPLKHYDHLFTLPTPAGTINERKTNVMEWGADGNFIIPESVYQDGTWKWHQIYADCGHGRAIPQTITDRVATDPTNMGVISSLLVLRPSLAEYEEILRDLERPEIRELVGNQFEWPEMQYLTLRWSGRWTNVDLRFHSLNGYPDPSVLFGVHYTGFKPWQFRKEGSMERYGRRPDFQLWHTTYQQMIRAHPPLLTFKKLRSLQTEIETFQKMRSEK